MKDIKFALVTAESTCFSVAEKTVIMGDFWNMYYWLNVFKGDHISYHYASSNKGCLDKYDVVMFSGHNAHFNKLSSILDWYKGISIFFPEGDISLYHDSGIIEDAYRLMSRCSITGIVEEDKVSFYKTAVKSHVAFLHVPVPGRLIEGFYFGKWEHKNNDILVYGDNNPNNSLIPLLVARKMKKPVSITAMSDSNVEFAKSYLGVDVRRLEKKVDQCDYLGEWVKVSKLIIYPTRWIGTSRQMISGAICGTPVIGTRDSHTQQRLFPALAVKNYDIDIMCELADKLYNDKEYYERVVKYAFNEVKFYSQENAKQRLYDALSAVGFS